MIETVGQGGAGRGHRLDGDEVGTFGMIDLDAGPGRSEGKRQRIIRTADHEAGEVFIRTQEEIIECSAGEFTIEILRPLEGKRTIVPTHGEALVIEVDMLEMRQGQSSVLG